MNPDVLLPNGAPEGRMSSRRLPTLHRAGAKARPTLAGLSRTPATGLAAVSTFVTVFPPCGVISKTSELLRADGVNIVGEDNAESV